MSKICPECMFRKRSYENTDSATYCGEDGNKLFSSTVLNYQIDGVLGKGGMGTVYSGFHRHMKNRVAIKVFDSYNSIKPELNPNSNKELVGRFLSEAQIANKIQ